MNTVFLYLYNRILIRGKLCLCFSVFLLLFPFSYFPSLMKFVGNIVLCWITVQWGGARIRIHSTAHRTGFSSFIPSAAPRVSSREGSFFNNCPLSSGRNPVQRMPEDEQTCSSRNYPLRRFTSSLCLCCMQDCLLRS